MYRWHAAAGGAKLEVKSSRPCIFQSDLSLSVNGQLTVLGPPAITSDGTRVYDLTSAQVAVLRTDPTAFLGLRLAFIRIPNMPDNRWGFRYRVQQGEGSLPSVYEDDGAPTLTGEATGHRRSRLTKYAGDLATHPETVVLS